MRPLSEGDYFRTMYRCRYCGEPHTRKYHASCHSAGSRSTPETQAASRQSEGLTAGFVYLVAASSVGLLKIGQALSPKQRLKSLQTGSPVPLQLLATIAIPAPYTLELDLHERFGSFRAHNEWYRDVPEIRSFFGVE